MEVSRINNELLMNVISSVMQDERDSQDGYYCTFLQIEGMTFTVYGNSHLRLRGIQRGGVQGISFWIDDFLSLITETDEIFDAVTALKAGEEGALVDECSGKAYFFNLSWVEKRGEIVNKIYVKTLLTDISEDNQARVKLSDKLIAYNRNNNTVSNSSKMVYYK